MHLRTYENMVETVQQYWPKGRSWARKEWMWGRYSNTLICWHYEFKKKKKKNHLETRCILVYKTILIKKTHYIFFQTHTILHSLSQTCSITNDQNHCCLHYFQRSGFFLCGMWKYMRSDWKKKKTKTKNKQKTKTNDKTSGRAVCATPVPSTPANLPLQKKSFVHEQVSDMQTSTLSRNKYTRSQKKKVSGSLTAFDKRDTDTLIEDIQKHSTVWWFCLSPAIRTYRHYWPRSLFQACNKKSESPLIDGNLPWGAYFSLPRHKAGKCVEVCLPLKTLPPNVQQLQYSIVCQKTYKN